MGSINVSGKTKKVSNKGEIRKGGIDHRRRRKRDMWKVVHRLGAPVDKSPILSPTKIATNVLEGNVMYLIRSLSEVS